MQYEVKTIKKVGIGGWRGQKRQRLPQSHML